MTQQTKNETLQALREILDESIRLYEANGRGVYEAGRIDGVKWCLEKITVSA